MGSTAEDETLLLQAFSGLLTAKLQSSVLFTLLLHMHDAWLGGYMG